VITARFTLASLILLASPASPPSVAYGTYIGGRHKDVATALAVDAAGNAWVVGNTPSPDFPVTKGAFKPQTFVNNDDSVGFATELSPAGDRFVYSTYIGGSFRSSANAVAVDDSGGAVVVGSTCSSDFPVTPNAFQPKPGGGGKGLESCDGYVVKLDPSGPEAEYATYLGGSDADNLNAVAVDGLRTVIAGWTRSPDLLGTAARGESDGLLLILDAKGRKTWVDRFGGSGNDWFSAVAVGADGTIWAAGTSDSADLPCRGLTSERPFGFIVAFRHDRDPACLEFAGQPAAISSDGSGHVYLAGSVQSGGRTTGFVLRLTDTHIDWYRRVGGSDETRISGISAGLSGSLFVCGFSYSRDFPVTPGAMARYPGLGSDMMLLRLSSGDGHVVYGTFLGGNAGPEIAPVNNIAVAVRADAEGDVWVAGSAIGHPQWISHNAAQAQSRGNTDAFVLKLKFPK
jgi:hypothetical protein